MMLAGVAHWVDYCNPVEGLLGIIFLQAIVCPISSCLTIRSSMPQGTYMCLSSSCSLITAGN